MASASHTVTKASGGDKNSIPGFLGGVYVGYEFPLSPQNSFAVEIFVNMQNSKATSINIGGNSPYSVEDKISQMYGVSLLPQTILPTNAHLFMRAGAVWGKIGFDNGIPASQINYTRDHQLGWDGGIGYSVPISQQIVLRAEYNVIGFSSIKKNYIVDDVAVRDNNKPMSEQFVIGLSYFLGPIQNLVDDRLSLATNGFYMVADLARAVGNVQFDANSQNSNNDNTINNATEGFAVDGGIGAGFLIPHNAYIGFEGDAAYNLINQSFSNNGTTYKVKYQASLSAAVLPGYFISPGNLIYIRAGVAFTRFNRTGDTSTTAGTNFTNEKKWREGLIYGVGFESYIRQNVSLRLEYDRTQYQKFTITNSSIDYTYHLSDNQFKIGLVYRF